MKKGKNLSLIHILDMKIQGKNMESLFEAILRYIPTPKGDPYGPTQILISTIDYDNYVGRIGIGKVERGNIGAVSYTHLLY